MAKGRDTRRDHSIYNTVNLSRDTGLDIILLTGQTGRANTTTKVVSEGTRILSKIAGEQKACKDMVVQVCSGRYNIRDYRGGRGLIHARHDRRGETLVFTPLSKGTKGLY